CTGGRETQGNIYRIEWQESVALADGTAASIEAVLSTPQRNSAWARQKIALAKASIGDSWSDEIREAVFDRARTANQRRVALQLMELYGPKPDDDLLIELSKDTDASIRSQAASMMAGKKSVHINQRLEQLLNDPAPMVRRLTCESLARNGADVPVNLLFHVLASSDRFEAQAARRLLETMPVENWEFEILRSTDQRVFLTGATAMLTSSPTKLRAKRVIGRVNHLLQDYVSDDNFVDMLRVGQLALHRAQIQSDDVPAFAINMSEEYPSGNDRINRELVRILSHLQIVSIADRYFAELERGDLPEAERLHLATHLALIENGWTTQQKLKIFQYLEPPAQAGSSVPGYLQNVTREFGKSLSRPETELALQQGHEYPSAAMAAVLRLPETLSKSQIAQLIELDKKIAQLDSVAANRLKVSIVAVLVRDGSDSSIAYLQSLYEQADPRRKEIAFGAAEKLTRRNWDFVIEVLPELEADVAKTALANLKKISKWPKSPRPYRRVLQLTDRLDDDGIDAAIALLEYWQGYVSSAGKVPNDKALAAWQRWYAKTYPDEPSLDEIEATQGSVAEHAATDAFKSIGHSWDYEKLKTLVQSKSIENGSAKRGLLAFEKAECAKCHRFGTIGDSVGPDLTTLAKRFRDVEILEAIVEPSKVISEQYASKTVITVDGLTHSGIVAESTPGEYVVTKSDGRKTVVDKPEVDSIVPNPVSVMPSGLLDRLTEDEIRDLFVLLTNRKSQIAQKLERTSRRRPSIYE
ncbi:MAG: c-type cytochrome, partial [Planctomycetales bacterium]|nr:c-type cytochrome [Planctomycetales bacterium]